MTIVDPALLVVVPTLRPLETFHALPAFYVIDEQRTVCGLPTHGWFPMSAGQAYNNVASPCPQCFPEVVSHG